MVAIFILRSLWLRHLVGGSTGPAYSMLHFVQQEKMKLAKMTQLSSGISTAIKHCVYVWWSLIGSFMFTWLVSTNRIDESEEIGFWRNFTNSKYKMSVTTFWWNKLSVVSFRNQVSNLLFIQVSNLFRSVIIFTHCLYFFHNCFLRQRMLFPLLSKSSHLFLQF